MEPVIEFDLDFDRESLINQGKNLDGYVSFQDPANGDVFDRWLIKKVDSGYAKLLADHLGSMFCIKDYRPRYYIQYPGFSLGFHRDRGTLCSFNFLLEGDSDPINFRDRNIYYRQCLLNTQIEHAVLEVTSPRLLFKISVFDKSYQEIADVLPFKLQCR